MKLARHPDARSFLATAQAFLLEREAEHNLILGIAGRGPADAWFVTVTDGPHVLAAAVRTPPFGVVLSHVADAAAIGLLTDAACDAYDDIPYVLGEPAAALSFAWSSHERTGREFEVAVEQRVHECDHVIPPARVPGRLRRPLAAERDLLTGWVQAFAAEATNDQLPTAQAEQIVDEKIATDYVVWDDGEAVSMAGSTGPTPNGIRVNSVYTPPEHRNHGYASACVAALTAELLHTRRFVFLYTDLANPTSNSIYRKIGYRPVCDVDQIRFL